MTRTVSAREIREAGGLEKWIRTQALREPEACPEKGKAARVSAAADRACPASGGGGNVTAGTPRARGRLPEDRDLGYDAERMNGLEKNYARHLEDLRRAGRIALWRFEAVKFRMADRTWYAPDFCVMLADGTVEMHETKGHWREDARVKIKTAAELFPEYRFCAAQWDKSAGEWKREWFRRGRRHDHAFRALEGRGSEQGPLSGPGKGPGGGVSRC